jgi:oligopeptide/dipeptide ABC transporter ATP-binding protein
MSYGSSRGSSGALPLLCVRGLRVQYSGSESPAVAEVDLDIARGETIGVLGESGSGKSTLALSLIGLLPAKATAQGTAFFHGRETLNDAKEARPAVNLLQIDEAQWRKIRGARISMIFQEPSLALSPVMRVRDQIAEVLGAHRRDKPRRQEIEEALKQVRLADVDRIGSAYPHQLSGGQLHRIAIAQAIACRPDLVIADEATRSLDVTVQAEVLNLLREINEAVGSALLFITHDPKLLAGFADRVIVMYAGRVVEEGPVERVFQQPQHPYTQALLRLVPSISKCPASGGGRLPAIPGSLTDSDRLSLGCVFEPRCAARIDVCGE